MRTLTFIAVGAIALCLLPLAGAETTVADTVYFRNLGELSWGGGVEDIAIQGDYAYCALYRWLYIVDISDRFSPVIVARLFMPECSGNNSIAVNGSYAYLSQRTGGLTVVDVSDPSAPAVVTTIPPPSMGDCRETAISGDYAYVACYAAGLQVLSLADPANPVQVALLPPLTFAPREVMLSGSFAYLFRRYDAVDIVDISDPANPVYAGTIDPGYEYLIDADIVGSTVYLSFEDSGLVIVDVSDPANPAEIGRYPLPGDYHCYNLAVHDSVAYLQIISPQNETHTIDVSDPTQPTLIDYLEPMLDPGRLYISENYAYQYWRLPGNLFIYEVLDPTAFSLAGQCDVTVSAVSGAVSGGYAFAHIYENYLSVIDISDPLRPAFASNLFIPAGTGPVEVSGNLACLIIDGMLYTIDVAAPATPQVLGTYDFPGEVVDLAVAGQHAFLADNSAGLLIVDISSPATPELVGSSGPGFICVSVSGDYAYAGRGPDGVGLHIIDISDPTGPDPITVYGDMVVDRVYAADGFAYVSNSDILFTIIDVSDPLNPEDLGSYGTGGPFIRNALKSDDFLKISSDRQLFVYDVSVPEAAELLADPWLGCCQINMAFDGMYVFGFDDRGLEIHEMVISADTLFSNKCGDANNDSLPNVADPVYIINYVFKGGAPPPFYCQGDANGDCIVNVGDAVYMINYIFKHGPEPNPLCCSPWLCED